jgi:undecaprenyl-diphosphatase
MEAIITAILLGIVEGLTEFIPVSSTGTHPRVRAARLQRGNLGDVQRRDPARRDPGGDRALLAHLLDVMTGMMRSDAASWRFARNILIAFIPSAVLGFILIDQIEALLENAWVVAVALILGGIAILAIERLVRPADIAPGVSACRCAPALGIGIIQCLSMIPGVSRSGATIMGALSLGVERKTAAEFSFFLAVPTMVGRTSLSIVKHRDDLASARSTGA